MSTPHNSDAVLASLAYPGPTSSTFDAGCAASFEVLHEYVEAELAGRDPANTMPGVAEHLRSCPACHEDYLGLLEAVKHFGDPDA